MARYELHIATISTESCPKFSAQVLEYTLFQPGLFLNYLASPYKTTKYVTPLDTFIDFQNRRAIVVDGHRDAVMTLTAVQDVAAVVARAVEYEGEWPKIGGISGNRIAVSQIIEIGERLRGVYCPSMTCAKYVLCLRCSHGIAGRPYTLSKVRLEDLEAGSLDVPWTLSTRHPSFTDANVDQLANALKTVLIGTLLSSAKGAWDVSESFNRLFPDYKFTRIEDFLTKVWKGVP